uniref:Uncharacterized protein n=1 Tax=Sphaerodactylus townsendi TaxID=933632 RepID=A0ACB8EAM7_9SAUR
MSQEAAPVVSRKRRLMAAVRAGESSSSSSSSSRSAASSPGPLCCFVCGGGIGRGKEQRLHVRPAGPPPSAAAAAPPAPAQPFFPFLQHQEPAPGARAVGGEGFALVCAVCRCFLAEQWAAFERARTPLDKRMYWLKRPHQCQQQQQQHATPGGAPREWNPAYDALADDPDPDDDDDDPRRPPPDSDLSSLSDSLASDAEPRSPGPPWRAQPAAAPRRRWDPPAPPAPLDDGLPPAAHKPRRKKPRRAPLWRRDRADREGAPLLPPRLPPPPPPPLPPREAAGCWSSEESEINITSDEEQQRRREAPGPPCRVGACYVCGCPLTPASQRRIHVQKQEQARRAPFFPFLWLHSPPPGALPISPAGSAWACASCFASLMQQWQSFELADVPVLQRLYVVPLDAPTPERGTPPGDRAPPGPLRPAPEACYLCGEDCAKDGKAVCAKITNGNAKTTMHFPFLGLLPCPPNAKGLNKHWEVRSCRKCYGVLQDLWAMYRACHNQEFITSVQSFLGRYHQVFSAAEAPGLGKHPLAAAGPACVCYICGAELGAGREFQLSVNPPGRFGEKEPFFPFLTVYPLAPRARPADSTGVVSACLLCYHDLLGQWLQYEGAGSSRPSNPWSRQYNVETFVCFFCRQEKKRCHGLKAVRVARLPVFLYSLRVPSSLLVDDGKRLTIGACAECAALVVAGKTAVPRELFAAPAVAPLPKWFLVMRVLEHGVVCWNTGSGHRGAPILAVHLRNSALSAGKIPERDLCRSVAE